MLHKIKDVPIRSFSIGFIIGACLMASPAIAVVMAIGFAIIWVVYWRQPT
tara:strand:- start:595 stop:744 length:150 start_codon:yes stop_codon:yes gene_type:complete